MSGMRTLRDKPSRVAKAVEEQEDNDGGKICPRVSHGLHRDPRQGRQCTQYSRFPASKMMDLGTNIIER